MVVQQSFPSSLGLLLDFPWGLVLASFLLGPCSGPSSRGLPLPLLHLVVLLHVLLAFLAICMSSDLLLAVQSLQQSVDNLAQAVALLPTTPAPPGSCGSEFVIGIVKDGYDQVGLVESKEVLLSRWVEEGPPEVPEVLSEEAKKFMQGADNQKADRIKSVFERGFWATAACTTYTTFQNQVIRGSIVIGHWVILRSPYGVPFRVSSFTDLQAFVNVNDKDTVCQGLESITDVEVFCCGAGVRVPPLWTPTKTD